MSASYYRQKPASLGDKLMASLKAAPADTVLFASLAVTAEQLDKIDRTMFQRVNSDMPAADYLILDALRRLGGDLMAAADEYQRSGQ